MSDRVVWWIVITTIFIIPHVLSYLKEARYPPTWAIVTNLIIVLIGALIGDYTLSTPQP